MTARDRLLLAGVLVALALCGLWRADLWSFDEPREAEIARAMLRSGDYAIPCLNGRPFLEKPPLFSATVASVWRLFGGPSLFLGRLVAAGYAALALGALFLYVRRALDGTAAWIAAGVLATTYRFHDTSHLLLLDNALVGFTAAAIVLLHLAASERRRALLLPAGLALAAVFLVKGFVGVALVGVTLATDLWLRRDRGGLRLLCHPVLLVAAALPVALWIASIDPVHRSEALHELLVLNQWGRFVDGYQAHPTAPWFYFPSLAGGLLPWTPLVLAGLWIAAKRARAGDDVAVLALAWTVPQFVLLSIARSRAGIYALPLTPGAALLVVVAWRAWSQRPDVAAWVRGALAGFAAVLALGALGATLAATLLGRDAPALIALLLAVAASARLWRVRHDARLALPAGLLLAAATGIASQGAYFTGIQRAELSVDPFARDVAAFLGDRPFLLYSASDAWSGVFGFRIDRVVREVGVPEQLERALDTAPETAVVMSEQVFRRLPTPLRARIAVEFATTSAGHTILVCGAASEPPRDSEHPLESKSSACRCGRRSGT